MPNNRTCPACGVLVLRNHTCYKATFKQPLGPKAQRLQPCTDPRCDKGWIERSRRDGSTYVVKCPTCPPAIRSNRATRWS